MTRRPASLFRGSELPRLVLLGGIVLAGWPLVLLFAQGPAEDPPPAPPGVPAAALPPVVAESGIEFGAILDKAPMRLRENAAYAILLQRARETSAFDLAKEARRDLYWTHLWERPAKYRGVPVHIEGTARRVLSYEINPELAPGGRMYETWVYSDENRKDPYVLTFETPPPGLQISPDQFTRITFDGYFLKLLGYRAGDTFRAAPMLVGRLHMTPAQAAAPPPMVEIRNLSKRNAFVIAFVLLLGYIIVRAVFQVRKALAPGRRVAGSRSIVRDEIAPEELADWLQTVEDDVPSDRGESDDQPGRR